MKFFLSLGISLTNNQAVEEKSTYDYRKSLSFLLVSPTHKSDLLKTKYDVFPKFIWAKWMKWVQRKKNSYWRQEQLVSTPKIQQPPWPTKHSVLVWIWYTIYASTKNVCSNQNRMFFFQWVYIFSKGIFKSFKDKELPSWCPCF